MNNVRIVRIDGILWRVSITGVWARIASWYSDWLHTGRSGDRIPVGVRFSAPVETCTGVHPASYTMGTGSFPEVKRPGRGFDHPSPSTAEARPTWPVLS